MDSPESFNAAVPRSRGFCVRNALPAATFIFLVLFAGSAFIAPNYKERLSRWVAISSFQISASSYCKNKCRPPGSDTLPEDIVSMNSNLEMRPLWGFPQYENSSIGLFTLAAGIKQRDLVDDMVKKFLSSNFSVMLFHYDGIVDEWKELEWSGRVIHVSAHNQTKWWFAKRFLHPDIVAHYNYIFLWDEDLGVEHFDPQKYVSIIQREGLEISQPALDPKSSEIHTQITARTRAVVHRRIIKPGVCDLKSTAPPCTGWVEMMAPVFSRAAWRCTWYMIQNDLIHGWGLDYQLGYCAKGDRTKNIGVVDAEYIVHYGRPTLGDRHEYETSSLRGSTLGAKNATAMGTMAPPTHLKRKWDSRMEVRRQSYREFKIFVRRWKNAAQNDQCWIDPYSKDKQF